MAEFHVGSWLSKESELSIVIVMQNQNLAASLTLPSQRSCIVDTTKSDPVELLKTPMSQFKKLYKFSLSVK